MSVMYYTVRRRPENRRKKMYVCGSLVFNSLAALRKEAARHGRTIRERPAGEVIRVNPILEEPTRDSLHPEGF